MLSLANGHHSTVLFNHSFDDGFLSDRLFGAQQRWVIQMIRGAEQDSRTLSRRCEILVRNCFREFDQQSEVEKAREKRKVPIYSQYVS